MQEEVCPKTAQQKLWGTWPDREHCLQQLHAPQGRDPSGTFLAFLWADTCWLDCSLPNVLFQSLEIQNFPFFSICTDTTWQGALHPLQGSPDSSTPDLEVTSCSLCPPPTAPHTHPLDPALSLLFREPGNGARQEPEQALLDTGGSESALSLHQAGNDIGNAPRALHHHTRNLALDGHVDGLRREGQESMGSMTLTRAC